MTTVSMAQTVVITGGKGSLAQKLQICWQGSEPDWTILCPSRQELDVTCDASLQHYFSHRACDLLIAAAGEIHDELLLRTSVSDWDRLLRSNLRGAAFAAKYAAKHMSKKRRGHVIFLGSYSAFHPPMGQIAYASAKAALIGLTQSLAKEWGHANIRVNLVLPGYLENRMTADVSSKRQEEIRQSHCLSRFNDEESVAAFIHSLHTQLPHTSGQIFNLDSRILSSLPSSP